MEIDPNKFTEEDYKAIKVGRSRMLDLLEVHGQMYYEKMWDELCDRLLVKGIAPFSNTVYYAAGGAENLWNDALTRMFEQLSEEKINVFSTSQTSN